MYFFDIISFSSAKEKIIASLERESIEQNFLWICPDDDFKGVGKDESVISKDNSGPKPSPLPILTFKENSSPGTT